MNRGTQNDLITFRDGAVTFCAVTPPGQSGFVGPDGGRSPHYDEQIAPTSGSHASRRPCCAKTS